MCLQLRHTLVHVAVWSTDHQQDKWVLWNLDCKFAFFSFIVTFYSSFTFLLLRVYICTYIYIYSHGIMLIVIYAALLFVAGVSVWEMKAPTGDYIKQIFWKHCRYNTRKDIVLTWILFGYFFDKNLFVVLVSGFSESFVGKSKVAQQTGRLHGRAAVGSSHPWTNLCMSRKSYFQTSVIISRTVNHTALPSGNNAWQSLEMANV